MAGSESASVVTRCVSCTLTPTTKSLAVFAERDAADRWSTTVGLFDA